MSIAGWFNDSRLRHRAGIVAGSCLFLLLVAITTTASESGSVVLQTCPQAFQQYNCRAITPPEADSIRKHIWNEDDEEWNARFRGDDEDCVMLYNTFNQLIDSTNVWYTTSSAEEGQAAGDDILFDDIVWHPGYAGTDIRRKTAIHETSHTLGCSQPLAIAWENYCIDDGTFPPPAPPVDCGWG